MDKNKNVITEKHVAVEDFVSKHTSKNHNIKFTLVNRLLTKETCLK